MVYILDDAFIIGFIKLLHCNGIKLFSNVLALITSAYSLEHHKTRQRNSCGVDAHAYNFFVFLATLIIIGVC